MSLSLAAGLALSGCTPVPSAPSPDAPVGALQGELTIFAAASLSASFTELADVFSAENPGVTIAPISFDGSSTLATQINEGAPADVFASADESTMQLVSGELASSPKPFASNELQIAVPPGNPLGITSLADLARPGVQLALCAPAVPCGAASHTLLDSEGIVLTPVTEEQNVKAVLTKVQLGEVDAGLVYVTDILNAVVAVDGADADADVVEGVSIDGAERARNIYPIAILKDSAQPAIAEAFVSFVLSDEGQKILAAYGFSRP